MPPPNPGVSQQYFQPIPPPPDPFGGQGHHYQATGRRRFPVWAIVLAVVLVVVVGGCGIVVWALNSTLGINLGNVITGGSPLTPPAGVHAGTQRAWRRLKPQSTSPYMGNEMFLNVVCGDLDGDGADEVFVGSSFHETTLFEIDGSSTRLPFDFTGDPVLTAWDYDGDGAGEIIDKQYTTTRFSLVDLAGQSLGTLTGDPGIYDARFADIDGDGSRDLVADDTQNPAYATTNVMFYGNSGQLLWQHRARSHDYNPAYGDIDGDGADEIIYWDQAGGLEAWGIDNQTASFSAWSGYYWPVSCHDLDGDGTDEVFASNNGYLNVVTGAYTVLNYPVGGGKQSSDPREKVYVADLDRDGQPELVTIGIDNYSTNSGLFCFDLQGNCTYYEEMGDPIEAFCVIHDAQGQDYLVVQTDRKLVIYP